MDPPPPAPDDDEDPSKAIPLWVGVWPEAPLGWDVVVIGTEATDPNGHFATLAMALRCAAGMVEGRMT